MDYKGFHIEYNVKNTEGFYDNIKVRVSTDGGDSWISDSESEARQEIDELLYNRNNK